MSAKNNAPKNNAAKANVKPVNNKPALANPTKINNIPNNNSNTLNIALELGKEIKPNLSKKIFILLIIIAGFFGIIALMFYNTIKKINVLQNKTLGLFNKVQKKIRMENIIPNEDMKETYVLYLNVDNSHGNEAWYTSYHMSKYIMWREDESFSIKYAPSKNKIIISTKVATLSVKGTGTGNDGSQLELGLHPKYNNFEVPYIPLQTWFQLVVMINNRTIDVYMNKLLVRTFILDNVPKLSNEAIILGKKNHNPNLYIGRLEHVPTLLTVNEIAALYFKNMRGLSVTDKHRKQIKKDNHEHINSFYGPSVSN